MFPQADLSLSPRAQGGATSAYRPRDPTQTLLYRVIQDYFKSFVRDREEEGRFLPAHVIREFESFLGCGILANGFMRLKCGSCRHEKLVAFSCKRRGFCSSCGSRRMSEQAAFLSDWVLPVAPIRQWVVSFPIQLRYWMARDSRLLGNILAIVIRAVMGFQRKGASLRGFKSGESGSVTLVQRFGGSANLNIHFHTLMIEGVYREEGESILFQALKAPSNEDVRGVLAQIQKRVVRVLKRRGYVLERNSESNESEYPEEAELLLTDLCQAASVQNRIALGENAGQRVRKLGSFGIDGEPIFQEGSRCASLGGFSIHANTAVEANEKDRLEKLCRYVTRPPIAEMRLQESKDGGIIYRFKKPWSDGTQAVYFTPQEFIEKLVALIPPPRIHLTRFHGVLGPHHRLRSHVVPQQPEEKSAETPSEAGEVKKTRDPRRLSWSELLKRVFQIDLTICPDCGGTLKFIATIQERSVVEQILSHLGLPTEPPTFHPPRSPPQVALWDEFSA
jgi:hypothetical protein